ncbi:MAG TPA: hypothetical protein VN213_10840 [Solirubrobacteraceae bacterium]|nr:hypothetical protein [Solirubrobacteraceae bacterium]
MEDDHAAEPRRLGIRASVSAPILGDGELWRRRASAGASFPTHAERRLCAFAELVRRAIANVDARVELNASRARIVAAADEARRRIERSVPLPGWSAALHEHRPTGSSRTASGHC